MRIINEVETEFSAGTSIESALKEAITFCMAYKCELKLNHNGVVLHINPYTDFELAKKYWREQL
jgi:hypothetical protein